MVCVSTEFSGISFQFYFINLLMCELKVDMCLKCGNVGRTEENF